MTNLFKGFLIAMAVFIFNIDATAGNQYEIKINISGNFQDSAILLVSYYGKKVRIVDTAFVVKKGEFIFEGQKKLPGGIYMAVTMKKKKLFEFIVSNNQKFTLQTSKPDLVGNMKVRGSSENKLFYSYLRYNEAQYQKNKELVDEIDSLKAINIDVAIYQKRLDSVNKQTIDYKINIIDKNKGTFVSALLNSMRDIEIPDSIKNSTDSTASFRYYKQHYWDYINLSDSTLLRTPVFTRKINQYFDQIVVFHPDSVIAAIDLIISKSRPSKDVTGYLVWYFVSEYQNPKYMGFDKVFVHLVDEYFSKEEILNTTPSILKKLQDRANKIRPILLNQPAPDLQLVDTTGTLTSFKTIPNDYTILFFWDYDCGICAKEIVQLRNLYDSTNYDIEIYAVNVNSDIGKWKKSIVDKKVPGINVNGTRSATKDFHDLYDIYGTPVIYILNKDKKIIAKRIAAKKINEFIKNYETQQPLQ